MNPILEPKHISNMCKFLSCHAIGERLERPFDLNNKTLIINDVLYKEK